MNAIWTVTIERLVRKKEDAVELQHPSLLCGHTGRRRAERANERSGWRKGFDRYGGCVSRKVGRQGLRQGNNSDVRPVRTSEDRSTARSRHMSPADPGSQSETRASVLELAFHIGPSQYGHLDPAIWNRADHSTMASRNDGGASPQSVCSDHRLAHHFTQSISLVLHPNSPQTQINLFVSLATTRHQPSSDHKSPDWVVINLHFPDWTPQNTNKSCTRKHTTCISIDARRPQAPYPPAQFGSSPPRYSYSNLCTHVARSQGPLPPT